MSLLLCLGIEFESVGLTLEVFTATTLQMEKSTLDPLGSIKSWGYEAVYATENKDMTQLQLRVVDCRSGYILLFEKQRTHGDHHV